MAEFNSDDVTNSSGFIGADGNKAQQIVSDIVGKEYPTLNNGRVDFSKDSGALALPNLCEIQLDSFRWFMEKGVDEVLREFFPIGSIDPKLKQENEKDSEAKKEMVLDYVKGSAHWDEVNPKDPYDAKEKNQTYSRKLTVTMSVEKPDGEVIQKPVFLGDYPMMTDSGTFIISGSERCIVSQIVRSPGAYIELADDKGDRAGYEGDIIPQRGTWIEFITDTKDILNVRIDKQRKANSITFLKALGLASNQTIFNVFGNGNSYLDNTVRRFADIEVSDQRITEEACKAIFLRLRPGEPNPLEQSVNLLRNHFFDRKHYDLGKAGRFKLAMKLGIYNRLIDKVLAEPLVSYDGEVRFNAGHKLTRGEVDQLRAERFFEKHEIANADGSKEWVLGAHAVDGTNADSANLFHIYEPLDNHGIVNIVKVFADRGERSDFGQEDDDTKRYVLTVQRDASGILQTVQSNNAYKAGKNEFKEATFNNAMHFDVDWDGFEWEGINLSNGDYAGLDDFLNTHKVVSVVGNDMDLTVPYVTISDIIAVYSYLLNIIDGVGTVDDIDNLSNRRVKCVGELIQNYFRTGLTRMEKTIREHMVRDQNSENEIDPNNLMNIKPLTSVVSEFFNSSQLSAFMDQTNPLAELSNKRRLSALGPGGISRDRASFEVRDIHFTHYGRICPIETPEGANVGLINNLACYAKIDEHGFIATPYRRVVNGIVYEDDTEYLSADQEQIVRIAEGNTKTVAIEPGDPDYEEGKNKRRIITPIVTARTRGSSIRVPADEVDFIDVSPKQIVSIAAASIPFLENDDTNRAQLACNMQRQALPLLNPHAPIVGTGMEYKIAHDSGAAVIAKNNGTVIYADSKHILVQNDDGTKTDYKLRKFAKANQATCINQRPIVKIGDKVAVDQIIADGPAMDHGDLALGQNETIAFMTWHGYDYEDAVVMSEKCRQNDTFTSIHIDEYSVDLRKTKLGNETFTRDVPNIGEDSKSHLDIRGIVVPGTLVHEDDILVGKITPKGETQLSPEEKLLQSIFSDKAKEGKDTSLRVPHGGDGIVQSVKVFKRSEGTELPPNVLETVKVYIIQKRKISEGDKMSGRHGNKGVISKLVPVEDMPFLPDGTPVDLCLNPLGVPSRMNIGQILEIHLGDACKRLGVNVATPVFDGVSNDELFKLMDAAKVPDDGKTIVYDGQTGERFENRVAVGCMYMIKLDHMVDDKVHARATGPYALVTQQPLGGKAQNGGQRFGEMEVWALEAYGAAHTLQEMLTIKSDDTVGRNSTYKSILLGEPIPRPSMPESFRVMLKELQGLAINITLLDKDNKPMDMDSLASENAKESSKIMRNLSHSSVNSEPKEKEESDLTESLSEFNLDEVRNYSDEEIQSEIEGGSEDSAEESFDDGKED